MVISVSGAITPKTAFFVTDAVDRAGYALLLLVDLIENKAGAVARAAGALIYIAGSDANKHIGLPALAGTIAVLVGEYAFPS